MANYILRILFLLMIFVAVLFFPLKEGSLITQFQEGQKVGVANRNRVLGYEKVDDFEEEL